MEVRIEKDTDGHHWVSIHRREGSDRIRCGGFHRDDGEDAREYAIELGKDFFCTVLSETGEVLWKPEQKYTLQEVAKILRSMPDIAHKRGLEQGGSGTLESAVYECASFVGLVHTLADELDPKEIPSA